jgi:hypothetical protein
MTDREAEMRSKRVLLIGFVIFMVTFLIVSSGFSQGETKLKSYSGVVKKISSDSISISVDEVGMSVSKKAKIVDEYGNSLTVYDLKLGDYVTIELLRNPDGNWLERIVVKKPKGGK